MPDPEYNELECARCGGHFHIELTQCPHCGVNVYEPEDENPPENGTLFNVQQALRVPLAVIAGWFISAFIGLMLYIPIRFAQADEPTLSFVLISGALTLSLGSFAGGFLYQRILQGKSLGGRLSQIFFSVLLGVLVLLTETYLGSAWSLAALTVIAASSFWGSHSADRMLRKEMIDELFAPVRASQQRYEDLLAKVGHDRAIAERLLEHERGITPKATRSLLIENAIKRWEKDNR